MSTIMSPADRLAELFASDGAADYLGERGAARLARWLPPAVTEPVRLPKDPAADVPGFASYRPLLQGLLRAG